MKKQYAVIKKTGEVIGERQRLNPDDFKNKAIMSSDLACTHVWEAVIEGFYRIETCRFCKLARCIG